MMTDRSGPIAINARAAARPELGGVERWARELEKRLPALRPDAYVVLRPPTGLAHRAGHAWEQSVLPLKARRLGAQALLCPANLAPLAYPRNVVVIHDAAPLRRPGWYSRAYATWQRLVLPAIARRARRVIVPSEFARRELAELLGVDAVVVAGGVDERFTPEADPEPARRALSLTRPYVLSVGSQTARKNLAALVPAARELAAQGVDVVVAGGHRPQFAREAGLDDLRLLGRVDDALLPGLYAGAELFALPSHYEGSGLPALEAMAAGTPVVAADAGALPETCGDAARLAPTTAQAFSEAVTGLLAAPAERERLSAAGRERARRFTWDRTARAVDGSAAARRLGAAARVAGRLRAPLEAPRDALEHLQRPRGDDLASSQPPQARPAEGAGPRLVRQPAVPEDALDPQPPPLLRQAQEARLQPRLLALLGRLEAVRPGHLALGGGERELGDPHRLPAVAVAAHHVARQLHQADDVGRLGRVRVQRHRVERACGRRPRTGGRGPSTTRSPSPRGSRARRGLRDGPCGGPPAAA